MKNQSLGEQLSQKRGHSRLVHFMLRNRNHRIVKRVAICLVQDSRLVVRGQKGKSAGDRGSLVSIEKGLCFRDVKRIRGGYAKDISIPVIECIHRLPDRTFDCTAVTQTFAAAMLQQGATMQLKDRFEREENYLGHPRVSLSQTPEQISVMSEHMVRGRAKLWVGRFQFTDSFRRFHTVATQLRYQSFDLSQLFWRQFSHFFLNFRDRHGCTLSQLVPISNAQPSSS